MVYDSDVRLIILKNSKNSKFGILMLPAYTKLGRIYVILKQQLKKHAEFSLINNHSQKV